MSAERRLPSPPGLTCGATGWSQTDYSVQPDAGSDLEAGCQFFPRWAPDAGIGVPMLTGKVFAM